MVGVYGDLLGFNLSSSLPEHWIYRKDIPVKDRNFLVSLLLLFSLFASPSRAAEDYTVSGVAHDSTGAVIPGALVTLRQSGTGAVLRAQADAQGSFHIPLPAEGTYQFEVKAGGFALYRTQVAVTPANPAAALDVILAVEGNTQTVQVTADALTAETTGAQWGGTLDTKTIEAVPLNGRSFTDLMAVQLGILPASSAQPNAVEMAGAGTFPPSGDLNPGNLSVSGQRETANGFVINGSNVEENFNMGAAIVPNLDSIDEFSVLTSNYDAEYGNYSGGQVVVVTKSGSNQVHGSVFEFLRNTALDARNYFASERAKFNRNQFGGTLGGPIKIDEAFFFLDYQGTRLVEGVETGLVPVPSLAERSGDVSDVANSLTGTVHGTNWATLLSKRLGYPVRPGEPYYVSSCTSSSQCVLPNAKIPLSTWSDPAQHLLADIPQPNAGPNAFTTSAQNETLRDDKGSARFDGATRWGMLSAYYFVDDYSLDNPYPAGQGGANVPGFNAVSLGRAQLFSAGLTKTLSTNVLNELHLSYMRFANVAGQPVGGVGPSLASQGFVEGPGTLGIVPLAPKIEGIENVSFNDFTLGVDVTGETQVDNTYQIADDFSRVMGRHTLKAGGGLHFDQIDINPDAVFNGSFQFEGTETGSDFADFLLGVASYYRQGDSRSFYPRNHYIGLYVQDTWRVSPDLTMNYGLRWDVLPPWYEKYNQQQTLVPGEQSVVYPGAPRGLVFPGDPGIPRTLASTKYSNVSPRVGIAYSPKFQNGLLGKLFGAAGETSVRAGYGMFYTAFEGLSAGIMSANPPYGYDYDSSAIGPPLFATPFVAAATGQSLGQPFPSPIPTYGASAAHPNITVDWSKYRPITGVPAFSPDNVSPYTQSYTLSLERHVGAKTLLSIGYVGNQAHHLLVLLSANPGNPRLCLSTPGCGPFSETGVREPFGSQFDADSYQKTIGNSNYNALEVSLRHDSGPLEFLIGYTYSKSIDQSSSLAEPVYPFAVDASGRKIDPSLSRAISAFDMTHNFVASYRYELPFVRLSRNHERLTKGWALSGIMRFSTGFPVTLFNNTDTSLLGTIPNGINNNGVDTPDWSGKSLSLHTNPRGGRAVFDTSQFSLPALGTIGKARRRFFYGPGLENLDVTLSRSLLVRENRALELRAEAFNVFNHAQFFGAASVEGNISSGSFGQAVSAMPPRLMQLALRYRF